MSLSDTDWLWFREAERAKILGQVQGLLSMGHVDAVSKHEKATYFKVIELLKDAGTYYPEIEEKEKA